MIDKQISWAITLGEVLEISNNENVCIPICYEDYDCIFNNIKIALKMKKMLYSNIFLCLLQPRLCDEMLKCGAVDISAQIV